MFIKSNKIVPANLLLNFFVQVVFMKTAKSKFWNNSQCKRNALRFVIILIPSKRSCHLERERSILTKQRSSFLRVR